MQDRHTELPDRADSHGPVGGSGPPSTWALTYYGMAYNFWILGANPYTFSRN